jgi:hypothetical protein
MQSRKNPRFPHSAGSLSQGLFRFFCFEMHRNLQVVARKERDRDLVRNTYGLLPDQSAQLRLASNCKVARVAGLQPAHELSPSNALMPNTYITETLKVLPRS